MDIKINTEAVLDAANYLENINKKIRDEVYELNVAINSLNRCWKGIAANRSYDKSKYIRGQYLDNHYAVLDSMAHFMKVQVSAEYERVDQSLVRAAAAFK